MKGRYTQHSKVMTIANHLVKQGYNRAYAMVKAWALVKLSGVTVKVAGVTYGKRQTALEHLTHYRPQDVRISLCRDKDNEADKRTPSQLLPLYAAKEPILWAISPERSRRSLLR